MLTIEEEVGGTVIRRTADYKPRRSWRTWLIGRPLSTADAPHQTIGKAVGLAVFASDALSSTAYATQEILVILAAAGTLAFGYAMPIAIAIVALLVIVTVSYEQTIHAYPGGGGAYIVAHDNLGELPAQTAGAALLTDYILTVAVSVSAGVLQLYSAMPALKAYRVPIAVGLVFFIMLINLRGVKESGTAFAIPTYFFLVMMFTTVAYGLWRHFTHALGDVIGPPELEVHGAATSIGLFLVLHAFASGTTALTGVEAISNGITAFKEPRSQNAGVTLLWMSGILGTLFLGITFLAGQIGVVPSEAESVVSQLVRTIYEGRGLLYSLTIASTTIILIMAANTAFADFPRLGALIGADGFLPRQLAYRGSRLVYSRGIMMLALIASLLIVAFNASVTLLIPLYAIGVFLSFTLSQAGMARRWWRIGRLAPRDTPDGESAQEDHAGGHAAPSAGKAGKDKPGRHDEHVRRLEFDRRWPLKMIVNGFGAVCTAVVMLVFAVTKFADGAWVVLILTPLMVMVFQFIHRHYKNLARRLSLEDYGSPPRMARHRVILTVSGVHRGTLEALRYANALSDDVTAVHVSLDPGEADRIRRKWSQWGDGVRLVILDSPYRQLLEPLLQYIEEIAAEKRPNETITIVVPRFVPKHWWENALHTQAAFMLRVALMFKPGIVITDVPYQVVDMPPERPVRASTRES